MITNATWGPEIWRSRKGKQCADQTHVVVEEVRNQRQAGSKMIGQARKRVTVAEGIGEGGYLSNTHLVHVIQNKGESCKTNDQIKMREKNRD